MVRAEAATAVLRLGKFSVVVRRRALICCALLAVGVLAALAFSLVLGPGGTQWGSLLYGASERASTTEALVFEWRLSRALAAALFGACLGLSGAIFQTITHNPLGSPDVLGLNAGAYAGVVGVLAIGASGYAAVAAGAVTGSVVAALSIYVLAFNRGITGFRMVIVGIAVSALLTALTSWFSVKAELDDAMQAAIWGAGTLYGMTWATLVPPALVALVLLTTCVPLGRWLPQLDIGDSIAAGTGMRVEPIKLVLVLIGAAFTAVVTAVAGPISFVALAAPQIARRITGGHRGTGVAGPALVGALLLSVADLLAQYLIPDVKLPVGAVTVVLGGGYLVWLLAREGKRS
ncbi:FecCD family ABC transporter permease [Galactobacter caseinivorans]|uniref:Iron-enterobactin ABC transporter permease n=1 Tax=Galactobacter caseinivorans TaxID=2676123 RepID=A0A496PHJ9_9MICC|nr:iron chelate uptake ABC transporter family permease subunit [Galactobacter caseinivorans]RKW69952.1 iron-enterobactin ABC transporter permease [Galactobacter caseinivorans]